MSIFLLFSTSLVNTIGEENAFQQQQEGNTQQQQDWNNPDYYNNLDWNSADLGKVQWDQVDWNQVDWNNINSDNLNQMLQQNANLFDNEVFLSKFEEKIKNFQEADFKKLGVEAQKSWLTKKSNGKLTLAEGGGISSYDGVSVATTGERGCNFDPNTLPKDVAFEIQKDGSLKPIGKFSGSFSGKVSYDAEKKILISDTSFKDSHNSAFNCQGQCQLEIGEDGTVRKISGEAAINGIIVKDLEEVSFDINTKIIHARPNQESSTIDGVKLFGTEKISYEPQKKMFRGNNFLVKSTSEDKIFQGKQISFADKEGFKVATLVSGETTFSLNGCSASAKSGATSCIAANLEKSSLNILAKNSEIILDVGLDAADPSKSKYKKIEVQEITDNSKVTLKKGAEKVASFDKKGLHPRLPLQKTDLEIKYNHRLKNGKEVTQVSGAEGDALCSGEECSNCNFICGG